MKTKVIKRIVLIAILIYAVYTFVSQQRILNVYAAESEQYNIQIEEEKEIKQELADTKEHLNSSEYIEDVAREELDMYLPNEKIYIDISK